MANFDDWITDLRLTRAQVEQFVADPENVGRALGPAAFVCISSGTTGVPGLFVHDSLAADVYWINPLVRGFGFWFGPRTCARFMQHGGREAQVIGTGAHFGGAAWSAAAQHRGDVTRMAITLFPAQRYVAVPKLWLIAAWPTLWLGCLVLPRSLSHAAASSATWSR